MSTMTTPKEKESGAARKPSHLVLFVCTGNTCRSPMAAAVLMHLAKKAGRHAEISARSCGLHAVAGEPISEGAVTALIRAGIPSDGDNPYKAHTATPMDDSLVEAADEIVPMTAAHHMELLYRYPQWAGKISPLPLEISDPYGGDALVYSHCLSLLTSAISMKWFGEEGTP